MSGKNNQRSNRDENCTNPATADDHQQNLNKSLIILDGDDDDDEDEDDGDDDDDNDKTRINSHQAVSIASPLSPGFAVK